MIVCIISQKFSILAIFIISLLLSCITPTDPVRENLAASRLDEDNQTATTKHSSQLIDDVSSDSNPETLQAESVTVIETDPLALSTENPPTETLSSTATSFIVNNQTTDDQQQQQQQPSSTSSTKKNLSSINSFEEWKQQQLHADLQKTGRTSSQNSVASEIPTTSSPKGTSSSSNVQQIASTTGLSKKGKLRKNFASGSCGAKILAHNVEAQNTPSILSSSPDEYMLNPCNAKIWFVIELCESIRILNIEIANFELFSSVPKTFRVSASDRYPTKDWHRHHLGTFNASHNRTIQSFQAAASTTYLKYVKFELLDFHGHEHYCPLSVVRVHGSNVEDEIMTMEENTNLVESKRSINIRDGIENGDDDDDGDDDNVDVSNDQQVGGIIGSAILDLAKRVFRRSVTRDTLSTTSLPTTLDNTIKPDCRRTDLNDSLVNDSIRSWRQSDIFKQCIAEFLMGLWSEFDTCALYLSQICFKLNHCCQCSLMRTDISNDLMRTKNKGQMSTLNLYINPCGYYHVLTNQFACKREKSIGANKNISTNVNTSITQDSLEKDLIFDKNDTMQIVNETESSINNQSTPNHTSTTFDESQNQSVTNRSIDQIFSANIPDELPPALDSQTPTNISDENSSQLSSNEAPPIDPDIFGPSIDTNVIDDASSPTASNYNEPIPPLISSPWLKGMLVNTKSLPELFKIIERLNFNLTLSNRYLQELSQHYVKKLDETQQTTDLLLKASKSADEKFEYLEEQLYKLQENYNDVSSRLIILEAWIPLIVTAIVALLFWCILTSWRLSRVRRKLKLLTEEFVKLQTVGKTEDDDDADEEGEEEDDPPVVCNGTAKRKLSSDSSESLPGRSQRVPDVCLSQIKENGIEKEEHGSKSKSSDPTRHLLPLSTI
ncbi:unnamed protein product [Adineta ricciae]|uniref:SUN domain-containing protein n=1 Tax=Adineta ricciae TaxID=249248 RepID=A0A813SVG0_ADIRI|nr:unnamed protein product [Adineta ricciae]